MFNYKRKRCTIAELSELTGLSLYIVSKDVRQGEVDLCNIGSIYKYLTLYYGRGKTRPNAIQRILGDESRDDELRCEIGLN
jgi:hypothetical protein